MGSKAPLFARVVAACALCALSALSIGCGGSDSSGSSSMDPTATPPAQTPVVVIPVYGGTWTGRWQHTSCTSLDVEFDWCNGITIGDSSGLTLTLTQAGNVGTTVSGTLNLSGVIMQVTGTIASDGSLSMTGSRGTDQAIENWKSTSTGSGMEGTFDWMQLGTNGKPTRRISDRLLNVTRTGT